MFFGGDQRPQETQSEPILVTIEDMEREHIRRVLAATEGRKSRAADILGIDRKTLRLKMAKYGIEQ
jgi:DNA-binding NtrC family response regulator